MSSFVFLDTWALVRFTKPDAYDHLSAWLLRTGLTVLVNSLSLIELYNPRGSLGDRCARVARFLGSHPCAIVKSSRVFDAELKAFPQSPSRLPIELDLNDMPAEHRMQALELFLRRDRLYLEQGKDIKEWAADYDPIVAVRRAKAALSSGCETHPAAVAPAGSNRSGGGGNEAIGASGVEGRFGDSANMQAETRVNAEQASKRVMWEPTRLQHGEGRCLWSSLDFHGSGFG